MDAALEEIDALGETEAEELALRLGVTLGFAEIGAAAPPVGTGALMAGSEALGPRRLSSCEPPPRTK
jgi:hypothetical protein